SATTAWSGPCGSSSTRRGGAARTPGAGGRRGRPGAPRRATRRRRSSGFLLLGGGLPGGRLLRGAGHGVVLDAVAGQFHEGVREGAARRRQLVQDEALRGGELPDPGGLHVDDGELG